MATTKRSTNRVVDEAERAIDRLTAETRSLHERAEMGEATNRALLVDNTTLRRVLRRVLAFKLDIGDGRRTLVASALSTTLLRDVEECLGNDEACDA